jgi:hypothetical protein
LRNEEIIEEIVFTAGPLEQTKIQYQICIKLW